MMWTGKICEDAFILPNNQEFASSPTSDQVASAAVCDFSDNHLRFQFILFLVKHIEMYLQFFPSAHL